MAILQPGRKGTAVALPRRRNYRQDFIHAFIELDNRKGRRVKTKRQVRARVKKNAESIPIPLGARHKMGFNKAFDSLVDRKLIETTGGENDPISWTAKGKEQLHAACAALAFPSGARKELSQDQLISIAQLFDRSSSRTKATRCTETKAQLKSQVQELRFENEELRDENSRLRQQLRDHKTALISAQREIFHLKVESVERELHGPLTPDPDDILVHPGGVENDGQALYTDPSHATPGIETIGMNEACTPPATPVPRVSPAPSPTILAPHPVRPKRILPSGSWMHPLSKQPSPAPTQAPGDEHEYEDETEIENGTTTDAIMAAVDGSDDDDNDEEEEACQSRDDVSNAAGQLPTPDHTPARPVRFRSQHSFDSLVLPATPQADHELQEELAQSKKEVAELSDQLEQKSNAISVLASRLSARDEEVKELTSKRDNIQVQLTAESLQKLKKTNQRRLATIAWVKGKNLDLHKQKLRLKRRIWELEDEMERKKGVLERLFKEYNQEGPPKKRKRVSI
ncbi:hypothetical protein L218DRAFT_456531 [Marasmius fiardii PR-910]|nr:hypothetical protein L218DRAFT_456531 [Marasmius fiardii PR-910]